MTAGAELAALLGPLTAAFTSAEAADGLLRDLGVRTTPAELPTVPAELVAIAEAANGTVAAVLALDDEETSLAERVVNLATAMRDLLDAIADLSSVDGGAVAAMGPPFDAPGLWTYLAETLPTYLLVRWLREHHRTVFDPLALLGVVSIAADGTPRLDLGRLADVAADPAGSLTEVVSARPGVIIAPLRRLFDRHGVTATAPDVLIDGQVAQGNDDAPRGTPERLDLSPRALDGRPGPTVTIEAVPDGVALSIQGLTPDSLDLGNGWALEATGDAGLGGVVLRPDGAEPLAGGTLDSVGLALVGSPPSPWILVGGAGTTRIELAQLSVGVIGDALRGAPEVVLTASTTGLRLVIVPGDGDSFLGSLLGSAEIAADMALAVRWSSLDGLSVDGGVGLTVHVPTSFAIGPLTVNGLTIGLAVTGEGAVAVEVLTEISGQVGPVSAVVNGMGLRVELRPDDAAGGVSLGPVYLALGFRPPNGAGLAIDAGVASGGGYLELDAAAGQYAGVLDLDLLAVGITAVVIIDTKAPDVDGWSMFFALFIEIPNIPLGFGFTLNGVGGLAGINRTIDRAALEAAVRSGSLDTILFPADPILDAPYTIDQMRAIFPPSPDRYVFGPVVKIGWGSPTLIEASLGIVISLPDPVTLAILGSVTALLPTEDLDLVALRMDVSGFIDFDAGLLSITASLHDSHVIGFALSGGMALLADFGAAPSFLMSVGGFHPGFDAPPGFPEVERLSLGISAAPVLDIYFGCYFALTSNTVQFGSTFHLSAQVAGFGIEGGTEFDALIFFSPFEVQTHLGFYVAVTAAGTDLLGVWLDASVTGPNPWHVLGSARFKILFFEDSVHLDEEIGSPRVEPAVPAEDLRDELLAALASTDAWVAVGGTAPGVLLGVVEGADVELVALPDGRVAVSQRVAPLGIRLDKVGDAPIGGYDTFTLEAADPSTGPVGRTDWFAPGYFFELGPSEQLSSPSFELLAGGIEFGGGEPTAGPARPASLDFEQILLDPELEEASVALGVFQLVDDPRPQLQATIAVPRPTSTFDVAADETPVSLDRTRYAVTHQLSGAVLARTSTWSAAHQTEVAARATSAVVPTWEVPS